MGSVALNKKAYQSEQKLTEISFLAQFKTGKILKNIPQKSGNLKIEFRWPPWNFDN